MLTERRKQVLRLLDAEYTPSMRSMAEAVGLKSHHSVWLHLVALELGGYVKRLGDRQMRRVVVTPKGKAELRRAS